MKKSLLALGLLGWSVTGWTAERIIMQGTAVIGNQELPKVLYIVPWKKSELPDLSEPPLASLIDEALVPIDRNVFMRQIEYYQAMHAVPNIQYENQ
ncbi:MAG: hypothetical protein OEZ39_06805 [Gammaproteobacteria bacterium]|nr:hypothetical protein [Gammaproteobacteria bacterium]MDH5651565.1 hypothetical protein [Gammaproteobacteria bacterium]